MAPGRRVEPECCSVALLLLLLLLALSAGQARSRNTANTTRGAVQAARPAVSGSSYSLMNSTEGPEGTAISGQQRAAYLHKDIDFPSRVRLSDLPVVKVTATSGYVTSWTCTLDSEKFCERDASHMVYLPMDHVLLVSFPTTEIRWPWYAEKLGGFAKLTAINNRGRIFTVWEHTENVAIKPRLFHSSIWIRLKLLIPTNIFRTQGFKMIYSIHPESQTPPEVADGVFNCSVPFYDSFRLHFDCNMKEECPGGEDEGPHCPFSSAACQGKVAVGSKCYFHVQLDHAVQWTNARKVCKQSGGDLATLKNEQEKEAFFRILDTRHIQNEMYIGLQGFDFSLPDIYRSSFIWVDRVVSYYIRVKVNYRHSFIDTVCSFYQPKVSVLVPFSISLISCETMTFKDFLCQVETRNTSARSSVTVRSPANTPNVDTAQHKLVICPGGHLTHDFLSCDPNSHCGTARYVTQCPVSDSQRSDVISLFRCEEGTGTLPFTLLCDFRRDCEDGSDETFCVHKHTCPGFSCHNGQCVSHRQQCNNVKDCWDGSDELCVHYVIMETMHRLTPPPALISFDNEGKVNVTELESEEDCPQTHFTCPDGYCLPLYCRCNGIGDCDGLEDEADCEDPQCPGLYRCRSSSVCVHLSHLCDQFPNCPQHDDEWLCHPSCPESCLCQGHSFRCLVPFSSSAFPQMRYLDASTSGMQPHYLSGVPYLLRLSVARCEVREVLPMNVSNLLFLDLSWNKLTSLIMDVFLKMGNLRELDMSMNPLLSLVSQRSDTQHTQLIVLDLSGNYMTRFNSTILINYPRIQSLNISHSSLTAISEDGLRSTPNLRQVDLRGSMVQNYPADIFHNLHSLQTIHAENYKLCCKNMLPDDFDKNQCFAPTDEISSCEDLLRSDMYRAFLWLFSVLSVTGNMGCLITRVHLLKRKSFTAFSIFVTNLSIADLFMGIYLALVGAADHVYRGQYFWFEKTWKTSMACQIAGFLSLLSSEMSAFIICLITLDRFLVLSSPFGDLRFKRLTASVTCSTVWLLGLCLAAVPLLPMTSEWQFYSQTGICIPLPITRRTFKGWHYAFGVLIVFNFILFLFIATGQAMVYWTIRTTSMAQSSTRKTKDLTIARRLVSVVVSDFLCWFPIGLLGILASSDTPVPGEINVGIAIFVLPLNAALNPFLYTYKTLSQRWEKLKQKQMMKQLEARSIGMP